MFVNINIFKNNCVFRRSSDLRRISEWIASQNVPIDVELTSITYKLLDKLEFGSKHFLDLQKLLSVSFGTLLIISELPNNNLRQIILLIRICSNLLAMENRLGCLILKDWFYVPQRSLSTFFNRILHVIRENNLSVCEIYWFINNLINHQFQEDKHQELDNFFVELDIKTN